MGKKVSTVSILQPTSDHQKELSKLLESGQDILYTKETLENKELLQKIYCHYILQNLAEYRNEIIRHNEKIKKSQLENKSLEEEFRDQGFTRPSVLIIVPFRNEALNVAKYLFEASGRPQEENKKRFMDEFGPGEEDPLSSSSSSSSSKPSDYCKLFEGNIDDCFRIGIKLTRRSLKLFTSFYGSDIILASPLGLRMAFEESTKKVDHDFLSSLRYVVVDSADVLAMQNWDHLLHVFKYVNLIPKRSHDCDFGRVKEYFLNGEASQYRQTVILSKYPTPEIQAFFKRELCNVKGKEKVVDEPVPILLNLENHLTLRVSINHVFQRVSRTALASVSEDRFRFFTQQVLPKLQSSSGVSQVCIFISSYFEFVQLREYFTENELAFTSLHDYATGPDISGARSVFFNKHVKYVLVTERFHYFRRYRIRGIENLFFYSLPAEPHFYLEYIHFLASYKLNLDNNVPSATILDSSPPLQIISLFDSFDYFKLSKLIGSLSASEMVRNNSIDSYLFSS